MALLQKVLQQHDSGRFAKFSLYTRELGNGRTRSQTKTVSRLRDDGKLLDLDPNSFRKIVTTLLKANGRGSWETSEENLDKLRELYQEVEDKIEGVE